MNIKKERSETAQAGFGALLFLNSMVVSVHGEAEPLVESITTVLLILQIYI